ncbi:MAG TPA: ArsC/Spx/MgsR family protein [Pyrinomonadaceae bacterium]|nr:ArsC/Spx/MgsR family protein [Pyrinomonadaceae bacterium]
MSEIVRVYEKPTCSKCREVMKMVRDRQIEYEQINLSATPLTELQLRELLEKMNLPPREMLRNKEEIYRRLNLGKRQLTDDQIIALMIRYPELIQRPIVERGERVVLGRPAEKVAELLDS